jgi:hypothetical protein
MGQAVRRFQQAGPSVALAWIWREVLKLIRLPLPFFPVCGRIVLDRDLRPNLRIFCVEWQPLFQPRLGIRLNRIDWTFRYTQAAINAFVGMDDEHILALVEAVHGAHFDAVHNFAANAAIVDDVGQFYAPTGIFSVPQLTAHLEANISDEHEHLRTLFRDVRRTNRNTLRPVVLSRSHLMLA